MKKRTSQAKKTTAKRTVRSSSRKQETLLLPFSFRRIILITTCLVLFVVAVVGFNKDKVNQSVAGMSVARGLFAQATVTLPKIDGVVSYNVYYKNANTAEFTNAARSIPASSASYTISHLKKGEAYEYKVSARDENGEEFWWSPVTPLSNLESM